MEYSKLDLFDLISERHLYIRSQIETHWNEKFNLKINNTEWYVIAKLYEGKDTIADITKEVHVSRQATHKLIKNLEHKQLIEIFDDQINKKIKKVRLTNEGRYCYSQYLEIKEELERSIEQKIGKNQFELLKNALSMEWQ